MACYETIISCKAPEGWCGKSEPFREETSKRSTLLWRHMSRSRSLAAIHFPEWVNSWTGLINTCISLEFKWRWVFFVLTCPCPGNLSLWSQHSSVAVWLWIVRVLLSEGVLAPLRRPSCGNCPYELGFLYLVLSVINNRGNGSERQQSGGGGGTKVYCWIPW